MQNADNLRTFPKKGKNRTHFPSKNLCWTSQSQNNPNPLLVAPSNLVTIKPPGPSNTSGSVPNNPTVSINTTNQKGGSEPNSPNWLINNPDKMRGMRPTNPSKPINTPGQTNKGGPHQPNWSINTLGQGPTNAIGQTNKPSGPVNAGGQSGNGANNPSWSINPVSQISGSGTNKLSRQANAPGQTGASGPNNPTGLITIPSKTSGSGPNMPSWSLNPLGQMSGSGMQNPSRPTNPLREAMKAGPNKPVPRFQPPQKGQPAVNVLSQVTLPTIPANSQGAMGNTNQFKDIANWMKSLRDLEDMSQCNKPPHQNPQDLINQNLMGAQSLLPNPELQKQASNSLGAGNNIKIHLNKVVIEQQIQQQRHTSRRKRGTWDVLVPRHGYPAGIPKSFLMQSLKDDLNAQSTITTSYEMPAWHNHGNIAPNQPTFAPMLSMDPQATVTNDPTIRTDTPTEIQQPYSPSDVYDESSFADDHDGSESSEMGQSAQKRLSAFQRLGPLSQPKKPKLTINLMFNKEQAVREVVDVPEEEFEKYTPVHLRQDIIASTDETVVKFLASWPWKKRVPLRRSVTSRSSKSVMMMEQEQMEEVYDKDNVFMQVTVKGYPKYWNKEHVLDSLLEVVKGKSFIPCFTEFSEEECKFLVLRSRPALIMFHKCGFVVRKDDIELTIVISQTDVSLNQVDYIPRLVLRKRLMIGYDGERKLNLKKFTLKEDISHFIYYPLNRLTNQMELVQLQNTIAWNYLTDLDLSYNRLTSISGLDLPSTTPRLKHLNLSHNYIEKATELLKCRDLTIHCIWLEGNPLCLDYIDSQHYIKVVKMMFHSVKEIDGVPITLKGDLPPIKRNYCPDEAVGFVEKFLEVYFPLLDSTPDERTFIQNMYADNATMTVTYRNKLRHGPVYRCFRNLFLRSRALEEGETDSVETSSSIVKLINRWPEFEHDPLTFTVDVLHYDDFSAILRVGGIVKLKAESLAEEEHTLAFTKTFVLRSNDGVEYKIRNELVYWDHPTEDYAATAFKVTTVKTKQMSFKLDSAPSEDLKDKLLDLFMDMTTLKRKPSERCLELKNWNFKDALEHFTKLLKLDSLESLTKDEV